MHFSDQIQQQQPPAISLGSSSDVEAIPAVPGSPPSVAKTKVPQNYLDAVFATEGTVKRYRDKHLMENDLIKAEMFRTILDGGFEGVKLSVTEQRVIHGIFNLLGERKSVNSAGLIAIGGLSELHAAMGLQRKKTRRGKKEFDGREVDEVNKVIWELAGKAQTIVYKKDVTPTGARKRSYDVYITRAPLYQIGYVYKDVSGERVRYVTAKPGQPCGSALPSKIAIKLHPSLVNEYRFFRLLPKDPYHEIKRLLPPNSRVQPHQMRFIAWLHRHRLGKQVIETNKQSLGEELGLRGLLGGRRGKIMTGLYRLARGMGFLTDYQEDVATSSGGRKDVLHLNPDRIPHVRRSKKDL